MAAAGTRPADGPGRGSAMLAVVQRPPGYTPRRAAGLAGYERVLAQAGLGPVAGIDEAGRGACAGPLVVAAVALDLRGIAAISGLADSKALTAAAREECYPQITAAALAWSVVVIPAAEIDRTGLHVCNVTGMRRALARLASRPGYVLTDGFPVRGLAVPALAMWKGDQVAASVAAASIVAKVTRDAIMRELHGSYPVYGFSRHKGYSTASHMRALAEHGPCPEHRRSFANVRQPRLPDGASRPPTVPAAREPDDADLAGRFAAAGPEDMAGPDGAVLAAGAAQGRAAGHNGETGRPDADRSRRVLAGFADEAGARRLIGGSA
ncbi:MAG: ribonuclease HII [Streptosporangiaceae bacterium]